MLRASSVWRAVVVVLGLVSTAMALGPILPPVAPPEQSQARWSRSHWAYRVVKRPDVPDVRETAWVRNPIDRFILGGLESVEFQHAPEADPLHLYEYAASHSI